MDDSEQEAFWREYDREFAMYLHREKGKRRSTRRPAKGRAEKARVAAYARQLSKAHIRKKELFGDCAKAETPKQARLLAHITGDIVREREKRALDQFELDDRLKKWFDAHLGFQAGADTLTAAHKGLRAHAAYMMSKKLRKFYRQNKDRFNFFFVTLIHDGWRSTDRETHVDLKDMKTRVRNVFHQRKRKHGPLNYVGVIEMDSVLNYPQGGKGICIMPHVHLIVWCDRSLSRSDLEEQLLKTTRLVSEWGAPTVDVGSRLTDESIVHTAYYMFEQPYRAKQLLINPTTEEHKLRPVHSHVPPHLTLRLSEILAHCSLKELILASGEGLRFKGNLIKALKEYHREAGLGRKPVDISAAEAFRRLRETTKKGLPRTPVSIHR
jgi:hypothetical protein